MKSEKIYEIGSMLGLEKKDINELKKTASNQKDMHVSALEPADGYNNAVGWYGTVSIKDF